MLHQKIKNKEEIRHNLHGDFDIHWANDASLTKFVTMYWLYARMIRWDVIVDANRLPVEILRIVDVHGTSVFHILKRCCIKKILE